MEVALDSSTFPAALGPPHEGLRRSGGVGGAEGADGSLLGVGLKVVKFGELRLGGLVGVDAVAVGPRVVPANRTERSVEAGADGTAHLRRQAAQGV